MKCIEWYFDFVSPFAYLQNRLLDRFRHKAEIVYRPVVFAGLLKAWGNVGPAEIPAKRKMTYRFCQWWADANRIPFKLPPTHPFNPIRALRLALAYDAEPRVVDRIFAAIWAEGREINDPAVWAEVLKSLDLDAAAVEARIGAQDVKDGLHKATDDAVKRGVFGVPTFIIDGEIFWGMDATNFALDYLRDPGLLKRGELARVDGVPASAERKR